MAEKIQLERLGSHLTAIAQLATIAERITVASDTDDIPDHLSDGYVYEGLSKRTRTTNQ